MMSTDSDLLNIQDTLRSFKKHRLIAVLRAHSMEDALWIGEQLIEGGVQVVEVTWTTPQAPQVLESLQNRYPNTLFGAGTILETAHAQEALRAGARFLVSPILSEALLQFGEQQHTLVVPGAMTPTEVYRAAQAGARVIKIFPAEQAGGPAYLKALLSVMPGLQLLPTGGVQIDQIFPYLQYGALAVGVGQPLFPLHTISDRDAMEVQGRVQGYLERIQVCHAQLEVSEDEWH